MIEKYRDGDTTSINSEDSDMKNPRVVWPCRKAFPFMDRLEFHHALAQFWIVVREMNGYVDKSAPWKLFKEKNEAALSNVLYTLAEGLRLIAIYLYPFMPSSAEKIWDALGIEAEIKESSFAEDAEWGKIQDGIKVKKCPPLFPRVE